MVALTDSTGSITDTFEYDTYGNLESRTGDSFVIFGYNGRDGVVTDKNGLIYMRARYYSPEMRRFVNADILRGEISDSTSLNRYSYVNGNPVSFVDPLGLIKERGEMDDSEIEYGSTQYINLLCQIISEGTDLHDCFSDSDTLAKALLLEKGKVRFVKDGDYINVKGNREILSQFGIKQTRIRADNVKKFNGIDELLKSQTFKSAFKNSFDAPGVMCDAVGILADTIYEVNQVESTEDKWLVGGYTVVTGAVSTVASSVVSAGTTAAVTAGTTKLFGTIGTVIAPGLGTIAGVVVGFGVGLLVDKMFDWGKEKYIDELVENN